ncbi:tetratricopeptide repeat protein [Compostibacter hankyongensis]|uniref:Tetratricopeptide repeat protein n=1 Tax=Compostibacter hankyongensis TaxID=1007089 RepID=A0ABP8FY95_9BACT
MKYLLLLILSACLLTPETEPVTAAPLSDIPTAAGRPFDFNTRCREAYRLIMMTRLDAGAQLLAAEKRDHPDNLAPYFLDNYIDFLRLFFHEDPKEYAALKAHRDQRLELMSKGDTRSPFYLYTLAMLHFQWAVCKIKFGENWSAVWEFRKAYSQIRDNQKKFPDFSPNKILLGSMQTVIGTVPESYRWITGILGFSGGNVSRGMEQLRSYVDDASPEGTLFHDEACFYYAYLRFYVAHEPDAVFRFIREEQLDVVNNQLFAFMAANLALNNHMGDDGLRILAARKTGPGYLDMPILDYEIGVLKLNHLELDEAIASLRRFTSTFKGKFYVKDALYKLSLACYLNGNTAEAGQYRKLIESRGNTSTDADKAALREARKGRWPNAVILRARLLGDGGYFHQALDLLSRHKVGDFTQLIDKIEYAYFLARIYDELEEDNRAIPLYEATIKVGASRPEYYAARAALQLGFIYEQRKDKTRALQYFKKCLDMKEEEYKSSLDQRAKAGINRLTAR